MDMFFEIINSLLALLGASWPIVVLVAILVFKDDVRHLMARIRTAKVAGTEATFDPFQKGEREIFSGLSSLEQAKADIDAVIGDPTAPPVLNKALRDWAVQLSSATAEIKGAAANIPRLDPAVTEIWATYRRLLHSEQEEAP